MERDKDEHEAKENGYSQRDTTEYNKVTQRNGSGHSQQRLIQRHGQWREAGKITS